MAPKRRLGEVLVECGMIDEFQLRSALSDQKRWGRPLGVTLVKLGFVEEDELLRVLSRQLDTPVVDLEGKRIAPEVLSILPVELVEKYRCIPLFTKREGGVNVLYLGLEDPTDLGVADDLAFRTGLKIRPVLVGPAQLSEAIERHYHKLAWEDDLETGGPEGFETPVEPGDTAPLVFRPDAPGRRGARSPVVGPEMLERDLRPEPEPVRAAAPPGSPEPAGGEPPGGAAPEPPSPALGPEFVTDEGAPVAAPSPGSGTAGRAHKPREVPTRAILRAVTQLLVDKGVITREELMERVRAADAATPARPPAPREGDAD